MASVTDYVPFNCVTPYDKQIHFDGKDHTISNFSCSDAKCANPSFFGVLNGSCRNLKMVNPVISAKDQKSGVLAASAGVAEKPATVENVTITNATLTSAIERAGGVCGEAVGATFEKVSFQGTVTSTYTAKEAKSGGFVGQVESSTFKDCTADVVISANSNDIGGFAGKVLGTATFTGCKVKVEATSSALEKNRVGGFIGWNASEKTVLTDCHVLPGSSLTDLATRSEVKNGNYGGLIGFGDNDGTVLEITRCSASVEVDGGYTAYNSCFIGCLGYASKATITDSYATGEVYSGGGNYTAGLIGSVGKTSVATVTNCHFSGTVNAVGGYVGGIIGGSQGKFELSKVYSEGLVKAVGAYVGGLVGAAMNDGNVVTNCYSTADVSAFGQQAGGLIGTTTNKLTLSNSYASGDVYSTTSGAAGVIGRVQKSSSITNCIAWNRNVSTSRTANNVYAPGAVLGCAQEAGTYSGCVRRYDMVFLDEWITLYDMPDYVNAMPPLPSYSTATHQQYYHGKAAAQGATLASVAQSLGWDSSIWNFASEGATLGYTIKQLGDNKIEF